MLNKHLAEGCTSAKVTLDGCLIHNQWDADCVSLDFHLLMLWEQCCPETKFTVVKPEENNSELMRLCDTGLKKLNTNQILVCYYLSSILFLLIIHKIVQLLQFPLWNMTATTLKKVSYFFHHDHTLIFWLYCGYSYTPINSSFPSQLFF